MRGIFMSRDQMGKGKSYVSMLIPFCRTPGAIERWKGHVEELKLYSSYQDAVGIDGEAIEFEWKNFQGFFIIVYSSRNPTEFEEGDIPARRV